MNTFVLSGAGGGQILLFFCQQITVRERNDISIAKLLLLCVDLPLCCWLWAATIQVAVVSCLCVAILVKEVIVTPRATDDSF